MTNQMRFVLFVAAVSVMAVVFAPVAVADTVNIPLTDPSFENTPLAAGGTSSDPIDCSGNIEYNTWWTEGYSYSDANPVVWHPTTSSFPGGLNYPAGSGYPASPASGSQCLMMTDIGEAVYQYVPIPGGVQADATYTLSVAIGSPKDFGHGGYTIAINSDDGNNDSLLYDNDDVLGKVPQNTGLFYQKTVTLTGAYIEENYPDAMGGNLFIAFYGEGGGGPDRGGLCFDNVQFTVTTPVPEPSTLALLAAAVVGLLAYGRRKGGK
jgi:hypothetical protein